MSSHAPHPHRLNRRQFLLLAATAVVAARPALSATRTLTGSPEGRVVNAGPVRNYAPDGQYAAFLDQGFVILRKGPELLVISSECTHRQCKLKVGPQQSFYCPCHGSTFNSHGKVLEGPAKRDLPILPSVTNESGQLLVTVPAW